MTTTKAVKKVGDEWLGSRLYVCIKLDTSMQILMALVVI